MAPGYALRILAVPGAPDAPLAISVDPAGGTLAVPADGIVAHGGTFMPVEMFSLWLQLHGLSADGRVLTVPDVESGTYIFCPSSARSDYASVARGGTPQGGQCAQGTVQPYGQTSLVPAVTR